MPKESWKFLPGWNPQYQISDRGRVKTRTHDGWLILKGYPIESGYLQLRLCSKGRQRIALIHTLVAETFLGPRPSGLVCHHKNHDKQDNRLVNLCYVTCQQNLRFAREAGRMDAHQKLSKDDILTIRHLIADGVPHREIADSFGVGRPAISGAIHAKWWEKDGCNE